MGEEEEVKSQVKQQRKKKGKSKKGSNNSNNTHAPPPPTNHNSEDFEDRLETTAMLLRRNLCRGLVRYLAALRKCGLLIDPPKSASLFTTDEMRFKKRFGAFAEIPQPRCLEYNDYLKGS